MGLGKMKVWRSGLSEQSLGFLKMKLLPDCLHFLPQRNPYSKPYSWASQNSLHSFHPPYSLNTPRHC
ncbi:hypothetical protein LEMLEM_LOCUS27304, partial [Lemmus lemmus]